MVSAERTFAHTRNVRRGTRSTTYPSSGASSAGAVIHRKVSPAAALEPVSVFTHMLSTISISESPTMLIARPANSRGKPGTRNAVRIMTRPGRLVDVDRGGVRRLGPGRPVDPVRPARHQPADHRDQPGAGGPPLRGGRAVRVAQHHLTQLLVQVPGLLRGQPHLRPADAGGLAPLRGLALAGGPGRAQPLQLALDDHVGQRLGGQLAGLVLVVADVVAPLEALADRLPGPVAAGAAAGLAHEAVLGQLAQVPRAVRRRLVDQRPRPGSRSEGPPSSGRRGWPSGRGARAP